MTSVPVGQAGRRYILKVDPPEFPQVVQNEAYFIRPAALAHFPVVGARIVHDATGRGRVARLPRLRPRRHAALPRPHSGTVDERQAGSPLNRFGSPGFIYFDDVDRPCAKDHCTQQALDQECA